jgi:hypothetical protein
MMLYPLKPVFSESKNSLILLATLEIILKQYIERKFEA